MSDVLDRINKENIEKYGEPCPKCGVFSSSCRCESSAKHLKKLNESENKAKKDGRG